MLLESSLCSNTATCVPQASQACWRIARDRKASGQYVRSEALWLDARLSFVHAVHSCGVAVDPSHGSLGARPDGYGAPGPKTLSALLASGLQYASLSGAAPTIVLEPRGRTNSASNSHSNASLQDSHEFAVKTSIVHNAAAAATIG